MSAAIGAQWAANTNYQGIICVGHSMGCLLLRKAYVYGRGQIDDSPLANEGTTGAEPSEWVRHVDRFVLLAGTNRGWSLEKKPQGMHFWTAFLFHIGKFFGRLTGTARLILSCEHGEPFIANLRIQWIRTGRSGTTQMRVPLVIQLLGDEDDIVSNQDSMDVAVSRDFLWIPVFNTGHSSVINFHEPGIGKDREQKFMLTLGTGEDIETLRRMALRPQRQEDPDVKALVFVMHGIRDNAEWTATLETPLQRAYQVAHPGKTNNLVVERSRYGFFAMGPFLLWGDRQRNVRWFMDLYTEDLARYPNLEEIDFVGHSNGTYLLASALERYRAFKINRVVFAGSVVRMNYPWHAMAGRIDGIRNYTASADWVVGIFPHLFETRGFRWINKDLGAAGFYGFLEAFGSANETKFINGTHFSALEPTNYPSVVDFIVSNKTSNVTGLVVASPCAFVDYSSRLCFVWWFLLIGILVGGGFLFVRGVTRQASGHRLIVAIVCTFLYLSVILLILCSI